MRARALLLTVVIVAAALISGVTTPTPKAGGGTALPHSNRIAIIGVTGLSWPLLAGIAGASYGDASIRGDKIRAAIPVESWAEISSGARYTVDARISSVTFASLAASKPSLPGKRHLGQLADAAHAVHSCVATNGTGYTFLAATDTAGQSDPAVAGDPLTSQCAIAAVQVSGAQAAETAARAVRSGRTTIVVGIDEQGRLALHPAAVLGPGITGCCLNSASTRRAGYLQLVDVLPTVTQLLGVADAKDIDGAEITLSRTGPSLTKLEALAVRAHTSYRTTPLTITALLVIGALIVMIAGRRRYGAMLWFGSLPAATFLAAVQPERGYVQIPVIFVLGAFIAGCAGTPRNVGAATAGIIALDVVLGARWQIDTPLGYSPLVAGRFAGVGNLAFGVFAAGVLLAMHRRSRPVGAIILLLAIVVDGAPFFGADLGGTLSLVPAGLLMLGMRGRRLVLAALGAVVLAIAFALIDLARPAADRTHLGRFAAEVGNGQAWDVIHRKLVSAVDLVIHSPLTMLALVVALGALVIANLRAGDGPMVPVIRSLSVAGVLGFILNDSGLAAAITLVWVAVPLIAAATRPPDVSRIRRRVLP